MTRILFAWVAAGAALLLPGCTEQCPGACMAPRLDLELCDAARANVAWAEASGPCTIDGSLWVTLLAAEGECHIVLHYENGTRSEIHTQVVYDESSCCRGYFSHPDRFQVPYPGCNYPYPVESPDAGDPYWGPDAASCPYPESGCYTHPDFNDCGCRCKGYEVPTAGVGTFPSSGCGVGCSCGFGATTEYDFGCAKDEDCILVRGGCCPCDLGGPSMAVLAKHQLAWEDQMVAHCPPDGHGSVGCPEVDVCAGRKAVCDQGRCRALQP